LEFKKSKFIKENPSEKLMRFIMITTIVGQGKILSVCSLKISFSAFGKRKFMRDF